MAEIHFMPTCSNCGAVLTRPVYVKFLEKSIPYASNELYAQIDFFVHPRKCQNCGAFFDSIWMPEKLPFNGYHKKED